MLHPVIEAIKRARLQKGLRGTDMAEVIGVTQAAISSIETGARDTLFRKVVALADHVGLDIVATPRSGPSPTELEQRVLDLMRETIRHLPVNEQEIWEGELVLRRRQLGLDLPARSTK
jgi:transcriptional regulator with XRE-family HTH domain